MSLGLVLVLELSLGFMVPSPVPGGLEVSVVEPVWVLSTGPVAGVAGLVWSLVEPVVLLELDPVALPDGEPAALESRSKSRGALASVALGRRVEVSVELRPLA